MYTAQSGALYKRNNARRPTIQYGSMKCGTHAQVLSTTLAHGNSKNEITKRNTGRR